MTPAQCQAYRNLVAGAWCFLHVCPLCKAPLGDRSGWHMFWECSETAVCRREDVIPAAIVRTAAAFPQQSLWMSGLIDDPGRFFPAPLVEPQIIWKLATPLGPVLPGQAFGDGSCLHPASPHAARAGWSVVCAHMGPTGFVLDAIVYGNLPCLEQDARGAELYAFLFYLQNAVPDATGGYRYHTDSQWLYDQWHHSYASSAEGATPHAGIWRRIDHQVSEIGGKSSITVIKILGHRKVIPSMSLLEVLAAKANACADSHAKLGAALHPQDPAAQQRMQRCMMISSQVVRFLGRTALWIQTHCAVQLAAARESRTEAAARNSGLGGLRVVEPRFGARHEIVVHPNDPRARCCMCWSSAPDPIMLAREPCAAPLGTGHCIFRLGPYVFCASCGAFSKVHALKLQRLCTHRCTNPRVLGLLSQGRDPYKRSLIGRPERIFPASFMDAA